MKTRKCFVSNSSSSSFVITYKDSVGWDEKLDKPIFEVFINEEQIKKLEEFGFFKSLAYYPSQVDWKNKASNDEELFNYAYEVTCNQDEVIEFLLKNKISFIASIHYNHSGWTYDGKSDKLIIAQNYGEKLHMSGRCKDDFKLSDRSVPIEHTTGKEYLETHKY